jgi:hypothetical protein
VVSQHPVDLVFAISEIKGLRGSHTDHINMAETYFAVFILLVLVLYLW